MALGIYADADPETSFSQSGDFSNPIKEAIDGVEGGSIDRLYYVRNDDSGVTYSGISLSVDDTTGKSIVDGTDGFSWKLSAGSTRPTETEWTATTAGAAISLDDIEDTSTFLPFWLRMTIPRNSRIKTYTDVNLVLTATEVTSP